MGKFRNLLGQRFGNLEVIGRGVKTGISGNARWLCKCDCGRERTISAYLLFRHEEHACECKLHRKIFSSEYATWRGMKTRCNNPTNPQYFRYGGRGIKMHKEWVNSFQSFFAYMGNKPSENHSIERINNDGNYEPGNVTWALIAEQARNRRSTRFLEFDGQRLTCTEWARKLGVSSGCIQTRLKAGWPLEKALTLGNTRAKQIIEARRGK